MPETFTHGEEKYEIRDGQCYRFLKNGERLDPGYYYRGITGAGVWIRNEGYYPGRFVGKDTSKYHEFALKCEDPRTFAEGKPVWKIYRMLKRGEPIPNLHEVYDRQCGSWVPLDTNASDLGARVGDPGFDHEYRVQVDPTAQQSNETETIQTIHMVGKTPKPAPFFMVNGSGPSTVRHAKAFDAIREAERLARENP